MSWLLSVVRVATFVVTTTTFGRHVAVNVHGKHVASSPAFEESAISSWDNCNYSPKRLLGQSYVQLQVIVENVYEMLSGKRPRWAISLSKGSPTANTAGRTVFDSTVCATALVHKPYDLMVESIDDVTKDWVSVKGQASPSVTYYLLDTRIRQV